METQKVPEKLRLSDGGVSNDEFCKQLAQHGKGFLAAGLSLVGEEGYTVRAVGLYQGIGQQDADGLFEHIHGWSYFVGHPKSELNGLRHIDSHTDDVQELAMPNTICYFAAEVDPALLDKNADQDELYAVIRFALAHIHD